MTKMYERRVAKGAALLDEKKPDWWNGKDKQTINLKTLDLESPCRCILGQTYPASGEYFPSGYNTGVRKLDLTRKATIEHGFTVETAGSEMLHFGILRRRWHELITRRRKAARRR